MPIFPLGCAGCGKGTQSEHLVDDFGYAHFDMGAEIRRRRGADKHFDICCSRAGMDQGFLLPDTDVVDCFRSMFTDNIPTNPFWISDGFPRSDVQLRYLVSLLRERAEFEETLFIEFVNLSFEGAWKRVSERRKKEGRADDAAKGIFYRRFSLYYEGRRSMSPILDSLPSRMKVEIDASQSRESISRDIRSLKHVSRERAIQPLGG